MTPDWVDLILSELGLDACPASGAAVAARPPASPHTVVSLPARPDEHDAAKRHCRNKPGAHRNRSGCVIADQKQKLIVVAGREETHERSVVGGE